MQRHLPVHRQDTMPRNTPVQVTQTPSNPQSNLIGPSPNIVHHAIDLLVADVVAQNSAGGMVLAS